MAVLVLSPQAAPWPQGAQREVRRTQGSYSHAVSLRLRPFTVLVSLSCASEWAG